MKNSILIYMLNAQSTTWPRHCVLINIEIEGDYWFTIPNRKQVFKQQYASLPPLAKYPIILPNSFPSVRSGIPLLLYLGPSFNITAFYNKLTMEKIDKTGVGLSD